MSTLTIVILVAVALVSYLIGAIPWGYLIGKKTEWTSGRSAVRISARPMSPG